MKVEIEIGELVLHGFPPAQRRAVAEALQRELARKLAASSTFGLRDGNDALRVDAGSFVLAPGGEGEQAGREAARLVGGVLDRPAAGTGPATGRKT